MKKIKSIKFKQINIIETEPNAKISDHGKFFAVQKEGSEIADYWIAKEYVDSIEYEPEVLKRLDGSLISEPEAEERTVQIRIDYGQLKVMEIPYTPDQKRLLMEGKIFLPEDKHIAEKKAKMLTKQQEIQYEIDRLNAEQGWTPNWKNYQQYKYFIYYNEKENFIKTCNDYSSIEQKQYMSETTVETILAKYSEDELKQYLGIII